MKRFQLGFLTAILCLILLIPGAVLGENDSFTDMVILSTTDMHGKCWPINLLTEEKVTENMLGVSTAVRQIRGTYGKEQVILIDNGDLFQGTPISETQIKARIAGENSDPLVMALCLREIGYDAFVLGNHEFNYDWNLMSDTYRYLEDNGVPVLAANVIWDGSDGIHEAGTNAFTPYLVRSVMVGGHEHKIGILGLENTDVPIWDLPVRYPGLMFAHPGNSNRSISQEARPYVEEMRTAGCEFIIVSYHSGLGAADKPLVYRVNSDQQGMRLIKETEGINMVIMGHDHYSGYSGNVYRDAAGKDVLVVNGGGQQLTQTVFRFREDAEGALTWELLESRNLHPGDYEPDPALKEKVAPYAELATEAVTKPIGKAAGEWDGSTECFIRQTDNLDLIFAATMEIPSQRLQELYHEPSAAGIEGLDHLDVDMAMSNKAVTAGYAVRPGDISMRDIFRLYRFANSILVIPMRGSEIRSIMEDNAETFLTARVLNGKVYYYSKGDFNTHMIFGGINFMYDMSRPKGERVVIEGFSNGRSFEENGVYLVSVNDFQLGNERCGLRAFSEKDAIWEQDKEEKAQDLIVRYIREQCDANGAVTTAPFTWHWSLGYTADPAEQTRYEGEAAARLASTPEEGHTYVICHEAERMTMGRKAVSNGFEAVPCEFHGNILAGPLNPEVQRFTVHLQEDGGVVMVNADGLYLTCTTGKSLELTEEMAEDGGSVWQLMPDNGGYGFACRRQNLNESGILEIYANQIQTYHYKNSDFAIFNFYEVEAE